MSIVDKSSVAMAFGRAATRYDSASELQQRVGRVLIDALVEKMMFSPHNHHILDAGCGTGFLSHELKANYQTVTALDLSNEMLETARMKNVADRYVQGDIEALPFEDESFCFSVSNLAVQWCHHLDVAVRELTRVVKKRGYAFFTTIVDHSLFELDEAWRAVDDRKHTLDFLKTDAVHEALSGLSYELIPFTETLYFDDCISVLRSLQNIGATTLPERRQGLMGRSVLKTLSDAYPKKDGKFPLTYHLVLGVIRHE